MGEYTLKLDNFLKVRLQVIKELFDNGYVKSVPYIEMQDRFSTQVAAVATKKESETDSSGGGEGGGTARGLRVNTKKTSLNTKTRR